MKKRNRIKSYLKIGLFLFGVSFLLINCSEDFQDEHQHQKLEYEIKTLSYSQAELHPNFIQLTKQFKIQKPTLSKDSKYTSVYNMQTTKSNLNLDMYIDMSRIKQITKDDYTSYTMRLIEEIEDPYSFYNIVIQENTTHQDIKILKYTPTQDNQNGYINADIEIMSGCLFIHKTMSEPCNTDGGDDFEQICEDIAVIVEIKCTGNGHGVGDNCDCQVIYPCLRAYNTIEIQEICYWDYTGSLGSNPPSSGAPSSGGASSSSGSDLVTSPISDVDGAFESITSCIPHLSTGQEQWLSNAQANNNTSSNFMDIWNYIGANGCSPITQEVISESINEDLINPDTFEEIFKFKKECAKIKRIFNDAPSYKQQLIDLNNGVSSDTQEKGIAIFKNDSSNPQIVTSIAGGVIEFDLNPSSKYISQTHTHDPIGEGNGTFSVNSFADLILTSSIAKKHKIKTNRFVSFLITAKGTRYAFTINNASKFRNAFYNVIMDNVNGKVDTDRVFEMGEMSDKYYEDDDAIIKTTNTDNPTVKKAFLQMLKEMDAGVTLFEISADFETFTQLTLEDDNTTITPQICN